MTTQPSAEAIFNEKTRINHRITKRYNGLNQLGIHGFYENLFRIVHEERADAERAMIERCAEICDWHMKDHERFMSYTAEPLQTLAAGSNYAFNTARKIKEEIRDLLPGEEK